MQPPRKPHLATVSRLLLYLKNPPGQGLLFPSHGPLKLMGYCDADWDGGQSRRRSVTSYCVFLGHSLVSWKSKKQSTAPRSSAEAECRAMAAITCELTWLRYLFHVLRVAQPKPTKLFCDI